MSFPSTTLSILLCLALAACVGRDARDAGDSGAAPAWTRFGIAKAEFSGSGPLQQSDRRRLVDSRLAVQSERDLLNLSSRYELVGGDLFVEDSPSFVSAQAPGPLGRQLVQQQLEARPPAALDVPLSLKLQQLQETRLLATAESAELAQQSAELRWAPAAADVSLSWLQRSGVAPALLSCDVQGAVRFSRFSGGAVPAIQLRGRDCDVFSPRLPMISSARSWSASLQWQLAQDETVLRLMSLQPEIGAIGAALPIDPAYELGVLRTQTIGMWQATLDLALRRGSSSPVHQAQADWSANAKLRRRIRQLDLSAGYRAGAGDDWFLPAEATPNDRFELGMSLTPWLDRMLPLSGLDAGVSYAWLRTATLPGEVNEDGLLQGKIRWRW
ncbi:MAG TPA: hypothetical protein VGE51_02180 [Fontimonas sp.]